MSRRGLVADAAAAGAGLALPLTAAGAGAAVRPDASGASAATVTAGGSAQLRLNWKPSGKRAPVRHHATHHLHPDGKRRFPDGAREVAFYLPALSALPALPPLPAPRHTSGEPRTRLEVRAAGEPHTASAAAASVFTW
ncbi:hypothetical protein ADK76_13035 [Streptomyces griseoflavus]|uniref:hypothetical protein n=1 Tax=Streptomyces rimosus TaxID=1927 RepID=UPI0004C809B0|nr:hypothetical protein [Streptomyces rimosus]KOG62177.1 hypothetical protein ADK76_13035 [Streptomyces griseoflavus]